MISLEHFTNNFVYVPDIKDSWRILKPIDGMYFGDCEDFSLTYLFLHCNESYLKFWTALFFGDARINYCVLPSGDGHAVLSIKDMYIDNITREFVTKNKLVDNGYVFHWEYFSAFQVARKLLETKLRG